MEWYQFGDLDWPLGLYINASRGLSAIAEFLVQNWRNIASDDVWIRSDC